MEAVVYSIADWPEHFENNRTKELRAMSWVPIPNKQDGDGYTELLDHPNGAAHFGAWVALIQVASKCDPRGTLLRDERSGVRRPHDAASLGRITRIPAAVFSEVLPRLLAIGWLIATPCAPTAYADPAVSPQEGAVIPQVTAPSCAHAEGKGMEGQYTEEKKNAGATKAAPLPLPQDFVRFWSAYPNPVAKGAALKAWEKTKRDRPPIDVLLEAVRRYAGSPKVREGFVANPATWLNQQRWLDAAPRNGSAQPARPELPLKILQGQVEDIYRERFRAGHMAREALDASIAEVRATQDREALYKTLDEMRTDRPVRILTTGEAVL